MRFFARDYWRLVAKKPVALLVAFDPALRTCRAQRGWALVNPDAAVGLVPAEFRSATQSERPWRDLTPGEQAEFTTGVFTNNIQVTLVAFAGGVTFGVLTGAMLIFNGILLGAIGGLMVGAGNWRGFLELVTGHGVLELYLHHRRRRGRVAARLGARRAGLPHAVGVARLAAREAVAIALGTAPWLVAAGIVEGNRARLADAGLGVDLGVGFAIGAVFWALVVWRGRVPRDERAPLPADTP